MSQVMHKLARVAVDANCVPLAAPGQVARINELTARIGEAHAKTGGMDLALVRAGADNLTLADGRGRGRGLLPSLGKGVLERVLADSLAGTVGHALTGMGEWFDGIGVGPDESERVEGEGKQGENVSLLRDAVNTCCRVLEEVTNTAEVALEIIIELAGVVIGLSKRSPVAQVAQLGMGIAIEGLSEALGIVADRNESIEGCLEECRRRCEEAGEHRPKPVSEFECPPLPDTGPPVTPPECATNPAAVTPPAGNPSAPAPREAHSPTPPAAECEAAAPAPAPAPPGGGQSVPPSATTNAGVLPTTPNSVTPPTVERCPEAAQPSPPQFAPGTDTQTRAAKQWAINITTNVSVDATTGASCPTPPPAPAPSLPTCAASASTGAPSAIETVTTAGSVSIVNGISEILACLEELSEPREAEPTGTCDPCCDCCAAEPEPTPCPEPQGEPCPPEPDVQPEPCPDPEPEPCPEPAAPEGPALGEGTIAPPPELAGVPEPPAPAEKIAAQTQAATAEPQIAVPDTDASGPAPVSAQVDAPEPVPPAHPELHSPQDGPGDGPRIKKTGGW